MSAELYGSGPVYSPPVIYTGPDSYRVPQRQDLTKILPGYRVFTNYKTKSLYAVMMDFGVPDAYSRSKESTTHFTYLNQKNK